MSWNTKSACLATAILLPIAAYASYGGGTPCREFGCHLFFWGLLVGVSGGIPASSLAFAVLHLAFCNRARSKVNQFFLGGFVGIIVFGISAACAALVAAWNRNPLIGLVAAFTVFAIASALYARSSPRSKSSSSTA